MGKKTKMKNRGVKTISWAIIVSALAVIGGQFFAKTHKQQEFHFEQETLCGAAGVDMVFDGLPINEPSGFGGSWGDQPLLPPGGGITPIAFPKKRYTGPNAVKYYEQPEFVKDYFRNLSTNFPQNVEEGNCGYVAAAMLLSYYDTYWNHNFIPDQYNNANMAILDSLSDKEFDSPGVNNIHEDIYVEHQRMPAPTSESSSDYKNRYEENKKAAYTDYVKRMLERKDEAFVALLYEMAIEAGVFDPESSPFLGTTIPKMEIFLNLYFSQNPALAGKVTLKKVVFKELSGSTDEEKRENLKRLAMERLKRGQPLIFGGDLRSGGGHICIAYDYYETSKDILCHYGYSDSLYNRYSYKVKFQQFNDFAYLDISPELSTIPNNPRFSVGGTAYSCHDLSSFVHKEQAINYGEENYHAIQCSCGDIRYEKHNFVYISNDTKRCTICGKTISTPIWSNSI